MGRPSWNRKKTISPRMSTDKNAKKAKIFLITISIKCLVTGCLPDFSVK
jgi:hypothetical protein